MEVKVTHTQKKALSVWALLRFLLHPFNLLFLTKKKNHSKSGHIKAKPMHPAVCSQTGKQTADSEGDGQRGKQINNPAARQTE